MRSLLTGLLFMTVAAITLAACQTSREPTLKAASLSGSQPKSAHPATPTHALFKEPVEPQVFELASAALTAWRSHAAEKPTLVLFSIHPFLQPLHTENQPLIRNLVRTASPTELARAGRLLSSDPLFISPQTVSAAIEAGIIGELVFVQPTTKEASAVSLTAFQQKVFAAGFFTEKETSDLRLIDGVIHGTVRGIPFRCVHPDRLPKIDRPVIVHIDLSYFMDLYVNDVKTPLYTLLYETARSIRAADWPAVNATFSYSNQEADFALDTRFLISNLATLVLNPTLLDGNTPPSWQLRSDSRFSRAMFAETTADEQTAQAVEIAPDDPDALYTLSLQKFVQKQPVEAFALLDRAVAIDPGYALAYLELAETGIEAGNLKKAEELLHKAANIFPNNPFIRIRLASLLIKSHRGTEAIPLLRELQQLSWSSIYHPDTADLLKQMLDSANAQVKKGKP